MFGIGTGYIDGAIILEVKDKNSIEKDGNNLLFPFFFASFVRFFFQCFRGLQNDCLMWLNKCKKRTKKNLVEKK